VRVVDLQRNVDESCEISMNEPLTHRQFTFYQSGFNESGHSQAVSVLNVAHDPGRPLKYAGSLMICLGIAIMFYMRAYFFRRASDGQSALQDVATQTVISQSQPELRHAA
jgi:ResB-like family protein